MKPTTLYTCSRCGAQAQKWSGRCVECGAWGTLEAEAASRMQSEKSKTQNALKTVRLSEVSGTTIGRAATRLTELDKVLGGGIVPGSLILVGGEPGIGKSTLLLQLAAAFPSVLYGSGEESAEQVRLRMTRLGIKGDGIAFATSTALEPLIATIKKEKPALAIIDSIQTIATEDAPSEAGSVSQVRAVTARLLETAKETNISIVLVGHVTKDGAVAGPKTLEHLVDVVLYLEGERSHAFRLLRSVKNRFGAVDEVGVFEMRGDGLHAVENAARVFAESRSTPVAGAVTTIALEGNRPFVVEVQALVTKTVFGFPQRRADGFDTNRLQLLLAVLTRRTKVALGQSDVFVNVAHGFRLQETAADLAVALAIVSAYQNIAVPPSLVAFGEIGLTGELRRASADQKRRDAATRLGYTTIIAPPEYTTLKDALEAL